MSDGLVRYERAGDGIAILTLADPPANTYSYDMMRELEFEEARDLGLVNEVAEAPDLGAFMERVLARAREFAPPGRASKAVGLIKRAVHSGAEAAFTEGLALERELQQQLFESEDAREGLAAHVEKRKPVFKGR